MLEPTVTPFPILLSTPQYPVAGYHLRKWTESDSTALINGTLNLDYSHWDPTSLDEAKFAFEAERLVRFPDSPNWLDSAWETANIDPNGIPLPGVRPGQTFFSFLVEHLLNQEGVTLEELPDVLKQHGFYVDGLPIKENNLFGDGQDASVFIVKINSLQVIYGQFKGVFGIHQVNGKYQVETLIDWVIYQMPGFYLDDSLQVVGDINGNGIPELIVEQDAYWSALTGDARDTKYLEIFEWQTTKQTFNVYDFLVYDQHCGDPPNCKDRWEWKFGALDKNGTQPLIVTRFIISESDGTGQPDQVTTYSWSEISQHLVKPGSNTWPQNDPVATAQQESERNLFQERNYQAAIASIEKILAKLPSDPVKKPDWRRPYLRYLLGIAYELNGQSQQAVVTYYKLWLDNPGDIFGVAARVKLEEDK